MTAPDETGNGPVVRDNRRIDPVTGQPRRGKHAATSPAGTSGAGRAGGPSGPGGPSGRHGKGNGGDGTEAAVAGATEANSGSAGGTSATGGADTESLRTQVARSEEH